MRYSLWINVFEDKYFHYLQDTNIEALKVSARKLTVNAYIFDHVRNVKVWSRYADGEEVDEFERELEILREAFHSGNTHVDFNKT